MKKTHISARRCVSAIDVAQLAGAEIEWKLQDGVVEVAAGLRSGWCARSGDHRTARVSSWLCVRPAMERRTLSAAHSCACACESR